MFKISDFSKLTQVSCRMLRYYDEMGLLKPAEVDKFSGYRLYSANQISRLKKIIALRDVGFLVAEIAVILEEQDENVLRAYMEKKQKEVVETIESESKKLKNLEKILNSLGTKEIDMNYEVTLKALPAYNVVSLREFIPSYWNEGEQWEKLDVFIKKEKIPCCNFDFTIYHDQEYKENRIDVEIVAQVEKLGRDKEGFTFRRVEPVPCAASIMITGGLENIAPAYQYFSEWLEKNNYELSGTSRQILHRGPYNEKDPKNYLIEIQIPINKDL